MHFGEFLRISSYMDACKPLRRTVHKALLIRQGSAAGCVSCTPEGHSRTGDRHGLLSPPSALSQRLQEDQLGSKTRVSQVAYSRP